MDSGLLAAVVAIVAPVSALAGAGATWAFRTVRRASLVVAADDAEIRSRAADRSTIKSQAECIRALGVTIADLKARVENLEQQLREIAAAAKPVMP